MFLTPLKGPLKLMAIVTIFDRPDNTIDVVATTHWLFWRTVLEPMAIVSDPAPPSQSREMVPALRSTAREQAFVSVNEVLKSIAIPVMFSGFCVSEKTKVNVWLEPMLAFGETELSLG